MKKVFSSSLVAMAIGVFLFFLVSCSKKGPPLVVVTAGESAPFSMLNEDGNFIGFDVDLIKMIAKSMGREVEFKRLPFEKVLDAVRTKDGDIAIGGISITEDRANIVKFSPPIHSGSFVLLLLEGAAINGLEDLSGKMVGVRAGSLQEGVAKSTWEKNIRNIFVKSFPELTGKDIVSKLQSSELAAVVLDTDEGKYIASKNSGFKIIPLDAGSFEMGIVTPIGSACSDHISKFVTENREEIARLEVKWFSAKN
ncbi:MAG: ABC transporter substrate-binding protein [Holosporales bacterium]|jgi:ABC-type amino acid transport substrate-binding protein|nr:ABC transporter substrate-binding protein [Holosporales bacterium]